MSFKDLVNESMRTSSQIQQEKLDELEQDNKKAAEYILSVLKADILNKAHNGKINETRTLTTVVIPYCCEDGPYGNIFETKTSYNVRRFNGWFGGFTDTHTSTMIIHNLGRLDEVFNILRVHANNDGISISDPFILCEITDYTDSLSAPKTIKRREKFYRKNRSLCATVKTVHRRGSLRGWHGEDAKLYLALDYTYSE